MKLEKELPEDLEAPPVPDLLRQHLLRKLRGPCKRVKIEAEVKGRSFIQLNAIKLAERTGSAQHPDVDEIAALITSVLYAYHIDKASDDGFTSKYRVIIEIRNPQGKTAISEKQFTIRYAPGADEDDGDGDVLRENALLDDALMMQRQHMDALSAQNSELFERFIELAQMMTAPIQASTDMHANATMMWTNGANMLIQGHQQQFQIQSVQEIEAAKTARVNAILMKFGGPLADLSIGMINGILKKFGAVVPGAAQPQAQAQAQQQPAQAAAAAVEESSGEEEKLDADKILAYACDAFQQSLTSKQRKAMHETFTPAQLKALDAVFCAESNDEVAETWTKASDKIPLDKLMAFASALDSEQQSDFMKLKGMIERHAEKLKGGK